MKTVDQVESTLFYNADTSNAFAKLADCVIQAFAQSQIRVRPRFTSETDLAFSVGALTLTIARSEMPLDLTKFIRARTPGTDFGLAQDVQRALVNHKTSIVIRVTGPATAAQVQTRLAVCYITTLQMIEMAAPDHIHWAKSEAIYTYDQFFNQTHDKAPEKRAAFHQRPFASSQPPMSYGSHANWKGLANNPEHRLAMDSLRTETLRRYVFSSSQIRTKRPGHSLKRPSLSPSAFGCVAFLVGCNSILSNLLTGLRLG